MCLMCKITKEELVEEFGDMIEGMKLTFDHVTPAKFEYLNDEIEDLVRERVMEFVHEVYPQLMEFPW